MADAFELGNGCCTLIAEYESEPVSALLLLGFGDTVYFKKGGWSGKHGRLHTNDAMHWAAIRWAHDQGYARYDFEGINVHVAADKPSPKDTDSISRFKLGFGGDVVRYRGTHDWANGLLARRIRAIGARLAARPLARSLTGRIRGI